MDLLDWHRGRLSSRRLAVLVRHLPRDSATLRGVHGEAADWSVGDHLLANVVDHLAEANWMFATVNRDEDAEALECPQPVPRPGAGAAPGVDQGPSPVPGNPTPAQLIRFFA
ncbi:hypothetical protein PV410_20790 [Streptomyces sp. PA03-5A]|nr:hypothetical protein [Streptomyces sp. PA03-5A]